MSTTPERPEGMNPTSPDGHHDRPHTDPLHTPMTAPDATLGDDDARAAVSYPPRREELIPETPFATDATSAARLGSGAVSVPALTQVETAPDLTAVSVVEDAEVGDEKITGKATLILRRLLRNKGAVLGLVMISIALLFALFGNTGNAFSYTDQDLLNLGTPPGEGGHRLGTSGGGIDLWAMLVRGTGKSLLIAVVVGLVAPILGAIYGTAIAFWGGMRERVGMWILDMLILMPYFLLIAVFMGSTGGSALQLAIFLTLFGWMGLARVVRATTQSLREREFVQSARYMGVSDWEIIRRHIIPNIGSYLILNIVLGTFGAIISETALSFLGVGVRPPDVSLGQLIGQSASQLSAYPWMFWGPTVCLLWITLSLSLVGDGLRDALDPNSKSGGRA